MPPQDTHLLRRLQHSGTDLSKSPDWFFLFNLCLHPASLCHAPWNRDQVYFLSSFKRHAHWWCCINHSHHEESQHGGMGKLWFTSPCVLTLGYSLSHRSAMRIKAGTMYAAWSSLKRTSCVDKNVVVVIEGGVNVWLLTVGKDYSRSAYTTYINLWLALYIMWHRLIKGTN